MEEVDEWRLIRRKGRLEEGGGETGGKFVYRVYHQEQLSLSCSEVSGHGGTVCIN